MLRDARRDLELHAGDAVALRPPGCRRSARLGAVWGSLGVKHLARAFFGQHWANIWPPPGKFDSRWQIDQNVFAGGQIVNFVRNVYVWSAATVWTSYRSQELLIYVLVNSYAKIGFDTAEN